MCVPFTRFAEKSQKVFPSEKDIATEFRYFVHTFNTRVIYYATQYVYTCGFIYLYAEGEIF